MVAEERLRANALAAVETLGLLAQGFGAAISQHSLHHRHPTNLLIHHYRSKNGAYLDRSRRAVGLVVCWSASALAGDRWPRPRLLSAHLVKIEREGTSGPAMDYRCPCVHWFAAEVDSLLRSRALVVHPMCRLPSPKRQARRNRVAGFAMERMDRAGKFCE